MDKDYKEGLLEMYCCSVYVANNKARFLQGQLVIDDISKFIVGGVPNIMISSHDQINDIITIYNQNGGRVSSEREKRSTVIAQFVAEKDSATRTFVAESEPDGLVWMRATGGEGRTMGQRVFGSLPKATLETMLRAYAHHLGYTPVVPKTEIVVASVVSE
jgi:hypothetical protein